MRKKVTPPWSGRFRAGPADIVKQFTESVSFDWRLYPQDVAGSIAHAKGLARIGVLTKPELETIIRRLRALRLQPDPNLEDVHMNVEAALGRLGEKLHAGRSRNDQVATDMRLWVRAEIKAICAEIRRLQKALVSLAEKNADVVMPGYTHLQRAQPVLFAHHLLAYVEMLERDVLRFADCDKRADVCPLGSGALAGSTLPLPRDETAKALGFSAISQNSMDAVSDRDFVVEFLAAAAICGMHLSRLAEDLVLWSTAEFGFVRIADEFTTGSSLMPQKKNPDVAELVRGKAGRLYGNLMAVLTVLKGLPLAYNRDLQEDKEPLFDSADTLVAALRVMAEMMKNCTVNRDRCQGAAADPALLATDLVDFLVRGGMAFRKAHRAVGAVVAESERTGKPLPELAARRFGREAAGIFDVRRALAARGMVGAPSPKRVRQQLTRWKRLLRQV